MKPVNCFENLKRVVLVRQLIVRSSTTRTLNVVLCFLVIYVVYVITKIELSVHGVEERRNEVHGRNADDGRWFAQRHPFELFVYSAFYDNRWSLQGGNDEAKWGQVTIVAVSRELRAITHCCLYFNNNDDRNLCLIAKATPMHTVIVCKIPELKRDEKWKNGDVPSSVSLHWGTAANQSTAFRVPVERVMHGNVDINHRTERPGNIAICLGKLFGDEVEPNIAIEWLEMMRLLGVEHAILYNHSASERFSRALTGYIKLQSSNAGFKVDLRQSWPIRLVDQDQFTPLQASITTELQCVTDCYYRFAGRYNWIVIHDLDELLTPRTSSHPNLLRMIEAITDNGKVRIGRFAFQLMYFYHELNLLHRNESWDETIVNGTAVNTSLSYFQTINLRWDAGPPGFNLKCIYDTDACVVIATMHLCGVYTPAFEKSSERRTVVHEDGTKTQLLKTLDVPPSIGVVHHYRMVCNFDFIRWKDVFRPGYCKDQRLYKDNIIVEKYGRELTRRLAVLFRQLNLTVNRFPKLPK